MKLRLQPAGAGIRWVQMGFTVLVRRPWPTIGLFLMFLFGSLLLLSLPLVGALATLVLLPTVTVGFMLASRAAVTQEPVQPGILLAPIRTHAPARAMLLRQGLAYAGLTLVLMIAADVLDGGRLAEWYAHLGSTATVDELSIDPKLQTGLLMRVLIALPLSVLFWHAAALAHWHGVPLGKSLFFSAVACVRNASAFVVYGFTWAAVALFLAMVIRFVASVLGAGTVAGVAALPAMVILSSAFYASLYFTYADSFEDAVP